MKKTKEEMAEESRQWLRERIPRYDEREALYNSLRPGDTVRMKFRPEFRALTVKVVEAGTNPKYKYKIHRVIISTSPGHKYLLSPFEIILDDED